jgi:hypothetical protein
MSKGKIYLSGGMEKAVQNGLVWRKDCSKSLTAMGYEPIDIAALDLDYNKAHGKVYMSGDDKDFLQYKSNIRHQFIHTDLKLIIDDADAVIGYYDQSFKDGAGSFAECQCAYDNERPLFVVSALSHVPSWLKALSTKLFFSFTELDTYLATLPDGILKRDRYGNHGTESHYLCSLCGEVFNKKKHHFVSKISPLYCKPCVKLVMKTREQHADRYEFISDLINKEKK